MISTKSTLELFHLVADQPILELMTHSQMPPNHKGNLGILYLIC